ncbi:MAG: shikimate kinase [Thermoleophilia bacterium]
MPSVVLIGFMGAGKSRVGSAVAQLLQAPFVDTDALIERQAGPIATIFAERGEAGFRRLEREVVLDALRAAAGETHVIALGGGSVTDDEVRMALTQQERVAWLTAPLNVVRRRVRDDGSERPLAANSEALARLYTASEELYRACATARFANDGAEPAEVVAVRLAAWARSEPSDGATANHPVPHSTSSGDALPSSPPLTPEGDS